MGVRLVVLRRSLSVTMFLLVVLAPALVRADFDDLCASASMTPGYRCQQWDQVSSTGQRAYNAAGAVLTTVATAGMSTRAAIAVSAVQGAYPEVTTVSGKTVHAALQAQNSAAMSEAQALSSVSQLVSVGLKKLGSKVQTVYTTYRLISSFLRVGIGGRW